MSLYVHIEGLRGAQYGISFVVSLLEKGTKIQQSGEEPRRPSIEPVWGVGDVFCSYILVEILWSMCSKEFQIMAKIDIGRA